MNDPDMDIGIGPSLPRYAKKGVSNGYKLGGVGGAAWGGYSGYAFMQHAAEGMHWSTQIVPYTYNIAEGATVGILLGAATGALAGALAGGGMDVVHRIGERTYHAVLRETVEEHGIDEAYSKIVNDVDDFLRS